MKSTKKKELESGNLADFILHQTDRIVSLTRLKLSLTAANQRLDRAYLALGELVAELVEKNAFDLSHTEVQHRLEMIRRLKKDLEKIQQKLNQHE
ncbi:MAG: hypothetical protein N2450_00860 [bacterium]|nr:hypothetical protein [bacterium]